MKYSWVIPKYCTSTHHLVDSNSEIVATISDYGASGVIYGQRRFLNLEKAKRTIAHEIETAGEDYEDREE